MVSDLMRSVTEIRLPTGEIKRVLLTMTVLPPLYGAPRRFWNLKFIAVRETVKHVALVWGRVGWV